MKFALVALALLAFSSTVVATGLLEACVYVIPRPLKGQTACASGGIVAVYILTPVLSVPAALSGSIANRTVSFNGYINRCAAEVDIQIFDTTTYITSVHFVDGWDGDNGVPNNVLPLARGADFSTVIPVAASPHYSDNNAEDLVQYVECITAIESDGKTVIFNACSQAMDVQYICSGTSKTITLQAMPSANSQDINNVVQLPCSNAVIGCVAP